MKKILITGRSGYIAGKLEKWLNMHSDYQIEMISLRDESWKEMTFDNYDTVVHLAGIAHVSTDPDMEDEYYRVNRDLTVEIAEKAKQSGVSQFIFMSSIIVYGNAGKAATVIDEKTETSPDNFYGHSKLQAEKSIAPLQDKQFRIAVIRPPMIYGQGSKGNYPKLAQAAVKLPLFPDFPNERSMLHIDNLTEFLRLLIKNGDAGLYFPQNQEYVQTSRMVKAISDVHGSKMKLVPWFNPLIKRTLTKVGIMNKVFGTLIYDQRLSTYKESYQIRSFTESIEQTEKG
nr:NAD-dependent epimerase/dehydratase family protein [Alkalicoccus halolimnae]